MEIVEFEKYKEAFFCELLKQAASFREFAPNAKSDGSFEGLAKLVMTELFLLHQRVMVLEAYSHKHFEQEN